MAVAGAGFFLGTPTTDCSNTSTVGGPMLGHDEAQDHGREHRW
jgi:hypothetical protein